MGNPLQNWMNRHQNPTNFWIHMVAIPVTFIAPIVAMILQMWILAAVLFVTGYAMQFLGHAVEGNRSGEEMLIRRLLGRK